MRSTQNKFPLSQELKGMTQKKCSVNLWKLLHAAANDNHIPASYWLKRVLPLGLLLGIATLIFRLPQ